MKPTRQASSRESRQALVAAARVLRQGQTTSERILWNALRSRRFEGRKFRRQSRIGRFIVDFYCAEEELVIGIDGSVHEDRGAEDIERQHALEALGLRVLRLPATEVEEEFEAALEQIRSSLTPAFGHPSPSSRERGQGVRE